MFRLPKDRNEAFRVTPGIALKNQRSGEIVFVPPQDATEIIRLMTDLERFENDDERSDLDPLIRRTRAILLNGPLSWICQSGALFPLILSHLLSREKKSHGLAADARLCSWLRQPRRCCSRPFFRASEDLWHQPKLDWHRPQSPAYCSASACAFSKCCWRTGRLFSA